MTVVKPSNKRAVSRGWDIFDIFCGVWVGRTEEQVKGEFTEEGVGGEPVK